MSLLENRARSIDYTDPNTSNAPIPIVEDNLAKTHDKKTMFIEEIEEITAPDDDENTEFD